MNTTWKLEDDLKTVTVTFHIDPPVSIKYDAEGIEEMLQNLGEFRGHMKPEIPPDYTVASDLIPPREEG